MAPRFRRHIPWLLTATRMVLLAPAVVFLSLTTASRIGFALCLIAALLSDYFDGVLARKWGVVTAGLRRFDSIADTLFCLAVLLAIWLLAPSVLVEHRVSLGILLVLELSRYLLDFFKYGREASYHMWSSKLWGLALYGVFFAVLVAGYRGSYVALAIWIGIFADLEGILMSLTLSRWMHDVPTLLHAVRRRRDIDA